MEKESSADSEQTDQTKSIPVKRIDVLPDEVLLEIFDFYTNSYPQHGVKKEIEAWQSLVHVCRRWRTLVFESPRRLNLRLFCSTRTPAKDTLDVWPALPLLIHGNTESYTYPYSGSDDIFYCTGDVIAALRQSNRVYEVNLWNFDHLTLKEVLVAMQVPFPELTNLRLQFDLNSYSYLHNTISTIPNSFLGGSAPHLQSFCLSGLPFPGLPNLLSSVTHLVHLGLEELPRYISLETVVALLSTLSSLRIFSLGFIDNHPDPGLESQSLPSLKRSILPALRKLHLKGVTKYFEELVAHIDTPQLYYMNITFLYHVNFMDNINFDTPRAPQAPRLAQFIHCTPTLRALDEGQTLLYHFLPTVTLRHRTSEFRFDKLVISISYSDAGWQRSFVDVCNSSSYLHPLSTVEDLYIDHEYSNLASTNDAIGVAPWLELLLPFTSVKNLYLSKVFVPGIMDSLQELVGARITEVLPSLQNIFVEGLEPSGPVQENIAEFVAARQVSDHPIAISVWYKDSDAIIKQM